jgi:signal transduction histidine kinase/ligand-binding sensor domain-containing protein
MVSCEPGKLVEPSIRSYLSAVIGSKSIVNPVEKQCVSFASQLGLKVPLLPCFILLFFFARTAWAVDPHTLISQYSHTAWRTQDGFPALPVAITQTTDGYIWIAISGGILRFDGVKFTPWSPPSGQPLAGNRIGYLLGGRDGTLWIGTTGGLSRFKNGKLFNYVSKPKSPGISVILEDHTGTIWVTRYQVNDGEGSLCRVAGDVLQCYGEKEGNAGRYGLGLAEDSAGNFWFGCQMLCRWTPGSSGVYFTEQLKNPAGLGVVDVAAGPSGWVWASLDGIGTKLGVRYYSEGKWASYVVPGFDGSTVRSHTLFVDRNQTLWVGTESKGIYHVHDGFADHYDSAHGLSGNSVGSIYEDREGDIWVATDRGIDLFRDTPVVTFSTSEGAAGADVNSVVAMRDGSVWIANQGGLDVVRNGRVSPMAAGHRLPGQDVAAMFEDSRGVIWLGIDDTVMAYNRGRFVDIKRSDGSSLKHVGIALAFAEDDEGTIWALTHITALSQNHLLRIQGEHLEQDIRADNIVPHPQYLAPARDGKIWVVSRDGKLARYRKGNAEVVSLANGESSFLIRSIFVGSDNALWAATSNGLYRWKDGQLSVMGTQNGLPCSYVYSAIQDNYGSLWLYTRCGLLKIAAVDFANWLRLPESKVSVRVFDALDGALPSRPQNTQPAASKSPDGRLWFASSAFVQMIDPNRSYINPILPPVHVEQVIADRKIYPSANGLRLPPLTRDLEIDYTALSFVVPQKVLFRYRLEGRDGSWQEPGSRRQAFYSDLRPGKYRFRVIASNNDTVWNETGATLDFSVAPAWYQTYWFRLLCVAIAVFLVWAIYRMRVQQIARAISARFDERLAERTRMARDLHDTFLQTIQGSKLVADDALEASADLVRMRRAMEQLSVWLERATREGRAALHSLRTSTTEKNDLAEGFRRAVAECQMQSLIESSLSVVGEPREMPPIVRDEVYRIGYEAIRNACVHSQASQLRVELTYARDLVLRVTDNGVGIDPSVVERGKEGHFGLQGMRERADRLGGKLMVRGCASSGSEIKLAVPGSIIYRKPTSNRGRLVAKIESFLQRMGRTSKPV